METFVQEFHYTAEFLLKRFGCDVQSAGGQQIFHELLDHLQYDGFDLRNFEGNSHRMLQQDTSQSSLIMNLIVAFICVVCAGLASGLTQVS